MVLSANFWSTRKDVVHMLTYIITDDLTCNTYTLGAGESQNSTRAHANDAQVGINARFTASDKGFSNPRNENSVPRMSASNHQNTQKSVQCLRSA